MVCSHEILSTCERIEGDGAARSYDEAGALNDFELSAQPHEVAEPVRS